MKSKFNDRTRFNWGYWDARFDVSRHKTRQLFEGGEQSQTKVSKSFDKAYHYGYYHGLNGPVDPESSEPAWKEWKSVLKAQKAQRKFIWEMRPNTLHI